MYKNEFTSFSQQILIFFYYFVTCLFYENEISTKDLNIMCTRKLHKKEKNSINFSKKKRIQFDLVPSHLIQSFKPKRTIDYEHEKKLIHFFQHVDNNFFDRILLTEFCLWKFDDSNHFVIVNERTAQVTQNRLIILIETSLFDAKFFKLNCRVRSSHWERSLFALKRNIIDKCCANYLIIMNFSWDVLCKIFSTVTCHYHVMVFWLRFS